MLSSSIQNKTVYKVLTPCYVVIFDSLHNFTTMLDSPSQFSVIIDESEASTIVISDDSKPECFDMSEASLDSVSIFGNTCQICDDKAQNSTDLEYQYPQDHRL